MKHAWTGLVVGCLALLAAATDAPAKHGSHTLLAFDTMYGVDGPFIGETNAIRGVVGDELPWEIAVGKGSLKENGHLKIKIRGLVFKSEDPVPAEKRGINDEAEFRALVSCLTEDGTATPTSNVMTTGFPATTSGNADIDATLVLPNPCVAPLVFVLSGSEDKWFSVNGFESEASGQASGSRSSRRLPKGS
jgi:hypothetical protein